MKQMVEEFGDEGMLTIGAELPFWKPSAECTIGDRAGSSISYPAVSNRKEAFKVLHRMQNDPLEKVLYDTWYVLKFEPMMRITIEAE